MFGLAWRAWGRDQQDLVDRLKENGILHTPDVELCFRLVDRALFIPESPTTPTSPQGPQTSATVGNDTSRPSPRRATENQAYIDGPVKIGKVHISAPHMYALVLEKLDIRPGMSFLNVGSGSGYLSCMASILTGRGGSSHGIERVEEVVDHARLCSKRWLKNMKTMRKEQRKAAAEEKAKTKKAESDEEKMKDTTTPSTTAATSSDAIVAPASSNALPTTGRDSPMSVSMSQEEREEEEEPEMTDEPAAAPTTTVTTAPSATEPSTSSTTATASTTAASESTPLARPYPFPPVDLSRLDASGEETTRRGVFSPSGDVYTSASERSGDPEVARAMQNSILPLHDIIRRCMVPKPSPSPASSTRSDDSNVSAEELPAADGYKPTFVPKVSEPQFIVGDAFDLDPTVCGLYDRIYVGAGTPESYIPFFFSLLHPGGRLVGPFGSSMLLVNKRRDGSMGTEKITDVSYAAMVLPERSASTTLTAPNPDLHFQPPVFNPPYGFSALPRRMKAAIDAILMLQRRDGSVSIPGRLPMSLWMHIMSYLPLDSYRDRTTGDVEWVMSHEDVLWQLTLGRSKKAMGEEMADRCKSMKEPDTKLATETAECLWEALAHINEVRQHLDMKMPTLIVPEEKSEDSSTTATASSSTPTAMPTSTPLTIGGKEVTNRALTELRQDPTKVQSGRTIRDSIEDQTVQLYWLCHWALLQHLTGFNSESAIQVARRVLGLRPNDTIAWRMLALNQYKDSQLEDALVSCKYALASSIADGESVEVQGTITGLQEMIEKRLPAYRRQQQMMQSRLFHMFLAGLGQIEGGEEGEEPAGEEAAGEEEEEEEEGEEVET